MSTMGDTSAREPYTGESAERASSSTEQAKEKVQETAQQAAGQARGQLRRQVDERSTQAGEQVNSTAADVRSVAQQLREQGKEQPAKLAEQAADRAERLGGYLKQSDGERILRDVEDFGRRQPWAVMFGGLAAGFLASRFLKASSNRRAQTEYQPPAPRESANGSASPLAGTPSAPVAPRGPVPAPPSVPARPTAATPPSRPLENVSLTAGVLPPEAPAPPRPGGTS